MIEGVILVNQVLAKVGLVTLKEAVILAEIGKKPGIGIEEMMKLTAIPQPTASKKMIKFEGLGLVSRSYSVKKGVKNHWCYIYELSEKGMKVFSEVSRLVGGGRR